MSNVIVFMLGGMVYSAVSDDERVKVLVVDFDAHPESGNAPEADTPDELKERWDNVIAAAKSLGVEYSEEDREFAIAKAGFIHEVLM